MEKLAVPRLRNGGGIMVNYRCTAACRHCLYACSPSRRAGYLEPNAAADIARLLRSAGCNSVHIGGGEPLLKPERLLSVIRALIDNGISIDYLETNAFWVARSDAKNILEALRSAGVPALCISVDPYHAEFIPYNRPLQLARLCEKIGIDYFLWKGEFANELQAASLDGNHVHSKETLSKCLGSDYLMRTARRYGIHPGGRAHMIEAELPFRADARALLDSRTPCRRLLASDHFHVDHEGFFIPPLCTGLRVPLAALLSGLETTAYSVYAALVNRGLAGLYALAETHCFENADEGYTSPCALCFYLRRHLAQTGLFAELDADYYEESLKYC